MNPRAALLLPLALLAANCNRATAPLANHVKLVLNWVPEPEFGGFYAARDGGAFAQRKLDVEIVGGGAGVPVVQMVAAGQADFGIAGGDEVVLARARGADIEPIFATFQKSPQGIMVHESRGTKSLADVLSGGTLALEPGLPYAQWLKKKYGFDKVSVVPYDGGVARFVKDAQFAQQCYVTSEPIAAKRAGSDPKVYLVADDGYDPYVGVVVVRRALLKEKPQLVQAFVEAARAGWRAYLDNPAPTNAVMAKLNPSMSAETFAAAAEAQKPLIENEVTKRSGLGVMEPARWLRVGDQLFDLGIIKQLPKDW